MLKREEMSERELQMLFEQMTHPEVLPFVRQKAATFHEFMLLNEQAIEDEARGNMVSRVIVDEYSNPIGTINLFDIREQSGFLGTWIGKEYHGKGFNGLAKLAFLRELFDEHEINAVFMRIRKENIRSNKAAEKLPYAVKVNDLRVSIFHEINFAEYAYDLYEIPKELFILKNEEKKILVH